jgi:hypothetical protein
VPPSASPSGEQVTESPSFLVNEYEGVRRRFL